MGFSQEGSPQAAEHSRLYAKMLREKPYLNAKEDIDGSVLKLVDHLRRPGVVQEVYVLEPACSAGVRPARGALQAGFSLFQNGQQASGPCSVAILAQLLGQNA